MVGGEGDSALVIDEDEDREGDEDELKPLPGPAMPLGGGKKKRPSMIPTPGTPSRSFQGSNPTTVFISASGSSYFSSPPKVKVQQEPSTTVTVTDNNNLNNNDNEENAFLLAGFNHLEKSQHPRVEMHCHPKAGVPMTVVIHPVMGISESGKAIRIDMLQAGE